MGDIVDVWQIEGNLATSIGGSKLSLRPQESIDAAMRREGSDMPIELLGPVVKILVEPFALGSGEFHPRIFRPTYSHANIQDTPPNDHATMAVSLAQLTALMEMLDRICRTIEPDKRNFEAYGHEIRNLLILACTEAESHWKAILVANSSGGGNTRFTTNDYVKLREVLRLDEYSLGLNNYPVLGSRQPFANWNNSQPTRSLEWFEAYNAVKHDRENQFRRGQLQHAIDAVLACAILIVAQYGTTALISPIQMLKFPAWDQKDHYVPPFCGRSWRQVPAPL
jgi:hypothetical protein